MRLYDFLDKTVIKENVEGLNIGDEVEITGNVQFAGATGVIDNFGKDKRFVIVNLYNHGRHSFHSSDVSFNDYADSDNEEADMYDRDEDFRRSMSNEHIAKVKGGYRLLSKHGNKNLGTYPTRAGAEKRERQVQYFKHAGESVSQGVAEATGDKPFDNMMKNISKGTNKQKTADRKEQQKQTQQRARDAFGNMFGGGNPADKLKIREQGVAEGGPFSYGAKKPRKGTEKYNIAQANKKYYSNKPAAEPSDQMVGNAKVTKNKEQDVAEGFQNDESNLFYRYDTADSRLKQKMIDNLDERAAKAQGYRETPEQALRVHNIIRSKFNPKKWVQNQGGKWVEVFPFGKQETKEASDISGLLSASKLNNVFVVKTDTKSYKVKAQSARVASEKVSKAHPEAKIVSVKDVTNTK